MKKKNYMLHGTNRETRKANTQSYLQN